MGITSELKGFIDRAHYLWVRHLYQKTNPFPSDRKLLHRGYFLATAGMNRDDVFDTAIPMMKAFFNIFGFAYCRNILAKDMDGCGGIIGNPEILQLGYQTGIDAVAGIMRKKPCK